MIFQIELAELAIEIHSIYNKVFDYCRDYIIPSRNPDIVIKMRDEDLKEEKKLVRKNQELERRSTKTKYSEEMLEVFAVHRLIANEIIPYNCFVMHGSALAFHNEKIEDEAIIFTANSGVGKTTHTQLWLQNVENAYIINGDKPIIKIDGDKIFVYGTPWQGKERLGCNKRAVLKAICFMKRNDYNFIEEVSFREIFIQLLKQCHRPNNALQMNYTIDLLEQMKCDYYNMYFNNFLEDTYKVASKITKSLV